MTLGLSDITIGVMQTGIAGLVMLGSTLAYMRMEFRNSKKDREAAAQKHDTELAQLREEIEADMTEAKMISQGAIENERIERRIDIQRLEKSLENLNEVPKGVALVAQAVENLAQRFVDQKTEQARAYDEVKHSVRGIHARLDEFAVNASPGTKRRPPHG